MNGTLLFFVSVLRSGSDEDSRPAYYTTLGNSCQEVSRNIFIFFLDANILTVEHGRRVQVPVTSGDGSDRGENSCGGLCSTCAHSGVVGGLSPGGIVGPVYPHSPAKTATRGGQGGLSGSSPDGLPLSVFCVSNTASRSVTAR